MKLGPSIFRPWKKVLKAQVGNIPCYFPIAQEAATLLAKEIQGAPMNVLQEVVFSTPTTALIDGRHEVYC